MTKMTTIPDNYDNIRAGIVELLKTGDSVHVQSLSTTSEQEKVTQYQ